MEGTEGGTAPGRGGVHAPIMVLDFKHGSVDFSLIPPRAVLRASPGPLGSRPGGFLFSGKAPCRTG